MKQSRREFIQSTSASLVCASALLSSATAFARGLKLPLGLQLYSVRDLLPKDFAGTLKSLGGLGFVEVESAGYYDHSAAEVKAALDVAGLKLVSAHYASDPLHEKFDEILAFNHELGVKTLVCSSPGFKDPARVKGMGWAERNHAMTLEDWRWNADQFNMFGEKVKSAGMNFGYHNHIAEFRVTDGIVPYDELLRLTDPAKVTMEMDCGWVTVGGGNPIEYLRKHPNRISMLHVKDFVGLMKPVAGKEAAEPKPVELGTGTIDYAPIFAEAARGGNIKHIFVEQEAFTVPPMQSLKMDADYMHKLGIA